jgi:hypothetical protein
MTFTKRTRTYGNGLVRQSFQVKTTPTRTARESQVDETQSKAPERGASGEFMTEQEMNIAIAKQFGWHGIRRDAVVPLGFPPEMRTEAAMFIQHIPNYCRNLNLMHEAEKTLPHPQANTYVEYLIEACGTKGCCMATARKRAEAFLRTIGKLP